MRKYNHPRFRCHCCLKCKCWLTLNCIFERNVGCLVPACAAWPLNAWCLWELLQPAGLIKEGPDGLLAGTALASRTHVHLVLLTLHLLWLAQRSAIFPYPCKEETSFLKTYRLLEGFSPSFSIISMHQTLFGMVRKYNLDFSLGWNPHWYQKTPTKKPKTQRQ